MAGVDLRTVQDLLGHKCIAMTVRYSHLAPKHTLAAVERLDAVPESPTGTPTATGRRSRESKQSSCSKTIGSIGLQWACPGGGMAYAGDLKSVLKPLQPTAPKRTIAKSPMFTGVSPHSHYALPRNQTHRIANPTDTTTDTSERAEVGNHGFGGQRRIGWVQRLCNETGRDSRPSDTFVLRSTGGWNHFRETRGEAWTGRGHQSGF